jgi:hypothetical protein
MCKLRSYLYDKFVCQNCVPEKGKKYLNLGLFLSFIAGEFEILGNNALPTITCLILSVLLTYLNKYVTPQHLKHTRKHNLTL